jgi:hypothetical protein
VSGGAPRGIRRRCGVRGHQVVRQVEQRTAQAHVVRGLSGEPRSFAEVGDRLGTPLSAAEVDPAGGEQVDKFPGADTHGLAEDQRLQVSRPSRLYRRRSKSASYEHANNDHYARGAGRWRLSRSSWDGLGSRG